MEEIIGYLKKVIFHNEENCYSIISLKIDQKKDENIILTGYFKIPSKKDLYRYFGEYVDNPKYGRQFKVESFEQILPNGRDAVIRFLSSSLFKGVGSATATKIVDVLGDDCLTKLRQDPNLINMVNIKDEIKDEILLTLEDNSILEDTIKVFAGSGIGMKYLLKMDAVYGRRLPLILNYDPYEIAQEIDGISFKSIDYVASNLGIEKDDPRRIKALLVYHTKELCFAKKDTYISKEELFQKIIKENNELSFEFLEEMYQECLENFTLIDDSGKLYYKDMYDAECNIASLLKRYLTKRDGMIPTELIDKEIEAIEAMEGIRYSKQQIDAIHTCLNSGISIITGGPGTGKTTVVKAIIKIYSRLFNEPIVTMLAPTGRASKRLAELSDFEATTIHRFLKWDLETNSFAITKDEPRLGHFLIVDEFSMVDCQLFSHLLEGTHPYLKILLIGDDQQLPPVSPGNVLKDLLDLHLIPTIKLIANFRQSEDSGIIPLCANIIEGNVLESNLDKEDVTFIPCDNENIREMILRNVKEIIEEGYSFKEIQVLSPMYDGPAGIHSINEVLQDYLNPHSDLKDEHRIGRTIYRIGDKILQLKNQPDDNVFNGDIGYLKEIVRDKNKVKLIIDFDGNEVTYNNNDFVNIALAYCISVHKSQGSEYNFVIMPFVRQHSLMLKRKLIYTGCSRAKKKLILLGNKGCLKVGVSRVEVDKRKTFLKERIQEVLLYDNNN